jgi:predicted DNA-binding protein (UPF0251 family)
MPRPRNCKNLGADPEVSFYKPQGIPLKDLKKVHLTHEEWESLRLKHVKGMNEMKTSQSTFQRILASAQKKLGQAVVEGKAIEIAES